MKALKYLADYLEPKARNPLTAKYYWEKCPSLLTQRCKYRLSWNMDFQIWEDGYAVDIVPAKTSPKLAFFAKSCSFLKYYQNKCLPDGLLEELYDAVFYNKISCQLISSLARKYKLGFPANYFCQECRFYYSEKQVKK